MELVFERVEETEAFAGRLARVAAGILNAGEPSFFIGLVGTLGAGKTAFVRGFVHGLDPRVAEEVSSPTYAIVQPYPSDPPVVHADLYRLSSVADLEGIGARELLRGPGLTLVEWIDLLPEAAPADWLEIRLAVSGEDVREMSARAHGPRATGLLADLKSRET